MKLLRAVQPTDQIQWHIFNQENKDHTEIPIRDLSVSDTQLEIMLGYEVYRPYRYQEAGIWKSGYGVAKEFNTAIPLLESEAYTNWISNVKRQERIFRRQLDQAVPQTVYDGLFSYFYANKKWIDIAGGGDVRYDVRHAVQQRQWTTVADMISNSIVNPTRSRQEGKIIELGEYPNSVARSKIKSEGLRQLRSDYLLGFDDRIAQKQAAASYFAETGDFLPGLTSTQQREISRIARPYMD